MKNILLIRHGQSEWNKLNLFTGFKNVELSEQGVEEANRAGQNFKNINLKFDLVYTSQLKRAQDTAKIILENLGQYDELNVSGKIIKNINLNERDYGDLTGLNKKETADKFGEDQVHKWRRGYSDRPPNGESLEDVVARVSKYFDTEIFNQIKNQNINNILIAAHGNSLRALLIVMN
ncbi:MAG: 2,3-bisphosphoglycerate-dependent phosphoglycerate mutase, partial [Pelagibacteraceae bacterium]